MGRSVIISSKKKSFVDKQLSAIFRQLEIPLSNFADIMRISHEDKLSIGIEQIKDLKEWGKVKPYKSKNKICIIEGAELMTEEAQNSALKILEESNTSLNLVLTTTNYRLLLPTILSRCILMADNSDAGQEIGQFIDASVLDRLLFVRKLAENFQKTKDYSEIRDFLVNLLFYYRNKLLKNDRMENASSNISLIQITNQMLKAHVLPKLALENLVINLK